MNNVNISASSLKTLDVCTFKFYCEKILKLPQIIHPKTELGILAHKILYFLRIKKHSHIYDKILKYGIYYYKPLARYIKLYCIKHKIKFEIESDLNDMILLALNQTNFYHKEATIIFEPELKFEILIGNYNLKGFIDSGAIYNDYVLLYDWKTQSNRFRENELDSELQSFVYQYYIWEKYKLPCIVEFVLLRHPPTKKMPNKTIQRVKEKSKEELRGFKIYLNYIGEIFKNFGYNDAISKFCYDQNFCSYICQFKCPFDYNVLLDENEKIIKMVRMGEKLEAKNGQRVEKRHHGGCPKFYSLNNII